MNRFLLVTILALLFQQATVSNLTGNWSIREPAADGTSRNTYIDLKQDGSQVTGSIRLTQFYYKIVESKPGGEGFTLTGSAMDGRNERRVTYEVKLVGDELHVTTRANPNAAPVEKIARRAPAGEGALPSRLPLPQLHRVPDNGLAKTPPMGWNSWNKFRNRVDDASVRGMADAMVASGMKAAGYQYINIDDTWEADRDAQGFIRSNKKFPDMKALADYVHSKGLKIGIYSSPGPTTCAGYEGTYGHEEQDAKTFAAWGIDYLKYDWCSARIFYSDEDMQAVYQKMGDALRASGRSIVYSLCQYGRNEVWKWGPEVGGNLWRTTGDIGDNWNSMTRIGFGQDEHSPWAKTGHWNDPDMLEIGNGGMSDDEYRTHMSLWSILAAPLLAGNDLRDMKPAIHDILTNREVIAIDQDSAGKQGTRASKVGDQEIWTRTLADGGQAIGLFNRGSESTKMSFKWTDAGLKSAPSKVRDLWAHQDVKPGAFEYAADVPSHGVVMLRIHK
jgi:alpha-galactosidase